jgi:hypothetical protein
VAAGFAAAASLAGCGTSSHQPAVASLSPGAVGAPTAPVHLGPAEHPSRAGFPRAAGRSLTQLGRLATHSVTMSAATGTFTPGSGRFAFALQTSSGAFLYGPTEIYVARTAHSAAQGPFPAPADPMGVAARYRSREDSGPDGIQAIYETRLGLPRAGTYSVLSLTRTSAGVVGAPGEVAVAPSSPIPEAGQKMPALSTLTAGSAHGRTSLLTTRVPAEHMASASLRRVLGHRPVLLIVSTPALCTSRVCGPVTDEAVALQHRFGRRVTFLHQEVYVDNDPAKGLRPQLKALHLRTEPWVFAINRRGVIVDRLEGAFGRDALTAAVKAALKTP